MIQIIFFSSTGGRLDPEKYQAIWVWNRDILDSVSLGLLEANEKGEFEGWNEVTRAEAALALLRVVDPSYRIKVPYAMNKVDLESYFWNTQISTEFFTLEAPTNKAGEEVTVHLDIAQFFDRGRRSTRDGDTIITTRLFDIPQDFFFQRRAINSIDPKFYPKDMYLEYATSASGTAGSGYYEFMFYSYLEPERQDDSPFILELNGLNDSIHYEKHYGPLFDYLCETLFGQEGESVKAFIYNELDNAAFK